MRDMIKLLPIVSMSVSLGLSGFAFAAEIKDMLGRWTWQRFTIEIKECADGKICAKVVSGPKNVGLEIFGTELTNRDGDWFGDIMDPETGTTYRTRMQFTGSRTWRLDGCTTARVCLSGEFVRAR